MVKKFTPTWLMIAKGLSQFGWQTQMLKDNKIVFVMRNERIEVRRITKYNKWKVEHYVSGKLKDIAGIGNELEAKLMASELAIIESDWR